MAAALNDETLAAVIAEVAADGFPNVSAEDVQDVATYGSVTEGVVGEVEDEALTDRILDALDARGIAV